MPRSGPCSPWISEAQIEALPAFTAAAGKALQAATLTQSQIDALAATAAMGASEILYELSGRQFSGECGPVTVRPLSRPTDQDSRGAWVGGNGFSTSWGYASSYDLVPGIASMYGQLNPPEIDLGAYPVTSIDKVLIDGVTIPSNEYELRDFRKLVRMRPAAGAVPTERWGWPTGQILDLPDTEVGTFSVTYLYGQVPPAAGQLAALKLAEYLALPQLGSTTHLAQRTTSVVRQGVTTQIASTMDVLKSGSLGIYEVDAFLLAVNPRKLQRRPAVFSPDVGRARRTQSPSLP